MRFQRGGTFLGFIIGLVVGLAVALVVAVYVTKAPVPFMNKNQQRSADQEEAEAKKNRDWDPNSPLHGKNPAPPPASVSGPLGGIAPPAPPAPQDAAPVAPQPPRPEAKAAPKSEAAAKPDAAAKPEAKPSADPLGDLARAKAGGADPFSYFVQAGAFRTNEDAEGQRAKLQLMGIESRVTEREQAGRTVYRVRVGPFDSKDAAEKAQAKLADNGVDAALVRVQR